MQEHMSPIDCMGGAMNDSVSFALTHSVKDSIGLVIGGHIIHVHRSIQLVLTRIRKLGCVDIIRCGLSIRLHPADSLFTVHSYRGLKSFPSGSLPISSVIIKSCGSSLANIRMIQCVHSVPTSFFSSTK